MSPRSSSPSCLRHTAGARPSSERGFALIITITLLAFLVLLLVSLATLTRVETQVAGNNQKLSLARHNAVTALNIALGELQRYAGPDQRVTATADLGEATADDPSSTADARAIGFTRSDNATTGLNSAGNGTRKWTGVWGNLHSGQEAGATAINNIYNSHPAPVLLNWLVSGNERIRPVTLNADGSIAAPLTASAPTPPAYRPSVVADLTYTTSALTAVNLNSANDSVVLVGANSVNRNGTLASGAEALYVVAPLVSLQVDSSIVPGGGNTPTKAIGRYAYWVGDEGVKARHNLVDPRASLNQPLATYAASPTDFRQAAARFLTAPRSGVERLTHFDGYPVNSASLNNVLTRRQIPFAGTDTTPQEANAYFHDLTTHSFGVLADTLRGGLRQDLSRELSASGTLSGPILPQVTMPVKDSTHSATAVDLRVKPAGVMNGPRWEVLRDFYRTTVPASGGSVEMRPASLTAAGITPVITEMRMGNELVSDGTTVRLRLYPLVFLGNPYDVDLVVPAAGLDVRIYGTSSSLNGGTIKIYAPNVDTDTAGAVLGSFNYSFGANSAVNGAVLRIAGGTVLAAGQVQVFSLAADDPAYTPPKVVPMVAGSPVITRGLTYATGVPVVPATFTNVRTKPSGNAGSSSQILPRSGTTYSLLMFGSDSLGMNLSPTAMSQATFDSALQSTPGISTFVLKYTNPGSGPFNFTVPSVANLGPLIIKLKDPFGGMYDRRFGVMFSYSQTRMYADQNLRASVLGAGLAYRTMSGTQGSQNYALYTQGGAAYQWNANIFTTWGNLSAFDGGVDKVVLYSIPRDDGNGAPLVTSLGQLQHANITAGADLSGARYTPYNEAQQPGHAIGNSLSPPTVNRNLSATTLSIGGASAPYYDISYLLNTALWDRYYFSTLPQPLPPAFVAGASPLLNHRLKFAASTIPTAAQLTAPTATTGPAAYLLTEGAFNVNSTSVTAWAAVLSGLRNLSMKAAPEQDANSTPFPRGLNQRGKQAPPLAATPTGTNADTYAGFRALSDREIYDPATNTGLAVGIVQQVRSRGPFVSLSHFINRMLVAPPTPVSDNAETPQTRLGLYGALQAAIELSRLYDGSVGLNTAATSSDPKASMTNRLISTGDSFGPFTEYTALATSSGATTNVYPNYGAVLTTGLATGAPGWLSQADLLQPLGPVIAARSDTFTIRCYGDVLDAVNSTNAAPVVNARAWCEAVVQRLPEYVDATDPTAAPTTAEARAFGRRFKVVSFRWLNSSDI